MSYDHDLNDYDAYTNAFDPLQNDRKARKKRKKKVVHKPKKSRHEIIDEIADTTGVEGGWTTTYTPTLYEEEFLLNAVRGFYHQALITDILAQVKGGKEASVYRCEAHHSTGQDLLAVKVYRPRKFRNLRNDKQYRQGRALLGMDGKEITERDKRSMRAVSKGSSFGEVLSHTSWLMYEYTTLQKLYAAGADVPQPFGAGENAIVMSYIGDENLAAPTLHEADLLPEEADALFRRVMQNVEILLRHGLIHGDLSAYNILYWDGAITLIDFPQVVDINNNPDAHTILKRDITRICDYFAAYDVRYDAEILADTLWQVYGQESLNPDEIVSMLEVVESEGEDDA